MVTVEPAYPTPSKWVLRLAAVAVPVFCIVVLVLVVPALPSAWRGFRGDGVRGTLTVTREECGKGGCVYYGDFVAKQGITGPT